MGLLTSAMRRKKYSTIKEFLLKHFRGEFTIKEFMDEFKCSRSMADSHILDYRLAGLVKNTSMGKSTAHYKIL